MTWNSANYHWTKSWEKGWQNLNSIIYSIPGSKLELQHMYDLKNNNTENFCFTMKSFLILIFKSIQSILCRDGLYLIHLYEWNEFQINKKGLPWWSNSWESTSSCRGHWVPSLVRELRLHRPYRAAKPTLQLLSPPQLENPACCTKTVQSKFFRKTNKSHRFTADTITHRTHLQTWWYGFAL